jgi:DNA helicase-2/ATP-dependent DNA helicase PcrA
VVELAKELSPAQAASEEALVRMYACLDRHQSFLVEAGAGAGKTYTLVKALQYLLRRRIHVQPRLHQRIACITFTNVAKLEIQQEIDRNPTIFCDTIHAFCWLLISPFQKELRAQVAALSTLAEKIEEAGGIANQAVEYSLGHRQVTESVISLHHDDVLLLTIELMKNAKFRRVLRGRFPVVLIDEYQDTNSAWIASIKEHYLGREESPLFGFFGDHWQKIYGDGCGKIEHEALEVIGVHANFRSVPKIVECLNRMRPGLKQVPFSQSDEGSVRVFLTNLWSGPRKSGGHWAGDLPDEKSDLAINRVQEILEADGWDLSAESTKILMLTHRALATRQGYQTIPHVFRFRDAYTNKEDPHIAFFADVLEPGWVAYRDKRFGEMFRIFGSRVPPLSNVGDKHKWSSAMEKLSALRQTESVGAVLDHLLETGCPRLPESIERLERRRQQFNEESGPKPRSVEELEKLRAVPYSEIISLSRYLTQHSPFETKHGVKGAEFENVLVIAGRGWNRYNFGKFLEQVRDGANVRDEQRGFFEDNRNLFYVVCSRPRKRLSILFTQELSQMALEVLEYWFGVDALQEISLD